MSKTKNTNIHIILSNSLKERLSLDNHTCAAKKVSHSYLWKQGNAFEEIK